MLWLDAYLVARDMARMGLLSKIFLEHPRSVGETYHQHFACATHYGFRLTVAGLACLIHAVAPSLFKDAASGVVMRMSRELADRRTRGAA
jgi:hypothetical protein